MLYSSTVQTPFPVVSPSRQRKVNFFDLRKPHIDALAQVLNTLDWSCSLYLSDVDLAYDKFLTITTHLINSDIPLRAVTISENRLPLLTSLHSTC